MSHQISATHFHPEHVERAKAHFLTLSIPSSSYQPAYVKG